MQTRIDISISSIIISNTQAIAAYKILGVIWKDGDSGDGEGVNEGTMEVVDFGREVTVMEAEVSGAVEIVEMARDCVGRVVLNCVVDVELQSHFVVQS